MGFLKLERVNLGLNRVIRARSGCAPDYGTRYITVAPNGSPPSFEGDVGAGLAGIPCEQRCIPAAQYLDTRVSVEQEPHGELPASGFLLGLIRDAVGKVRRCPEKTQHVRVGAADMTGVSGFHTQEKKEIQRFALQFFGQRIGLGADEIGDSHGVFLVPDVFRL
jgi:hypothetical protein